MELRGKKILIISQQDWGTMFLSKHHYSVELAKLGNTVYYINGPDQRGNMKPGQVLIEPTGFNNLYSITHRQFFPYMLKFKARWLYDLLIKYHIKKLASAVGGEFDIVWSFDFSNTIPLKAFNVRACKILTAADDSNDSTAIKAAEGANLILSVAEELLSKYQTTSIPCRNIGHGVASYFINDATTLQHNTTTQVGISGNMLRPDIDFGTFLTIIREHKDVVFNFWGSIDYVGSNLAADRNEDVINFINALKDIDNVVLHGQLPPENLALELRKMDCFLICYDVDKDQSKGTNYHKILEYLATGKVIVSNYVSAYKDRPDLVLMPPERTNEQLPSLFSTVLSRIDEYNALQKQQARVKYAEGFTYTTQIKNIEKLLAEVC